MLISFTVGNYRSIKDPVTLSMVCSRIKELPKNVIETKRKGLKLLKSAVIYGANASGKSNVIKAMEFMGNFIRYSSKDTQKDDEIPVDSFLFNTETVGKPSHFEIVFLIDETIYRYGFEADRKKVHSEWLYSNPKGKDRELFFRDGNEFKIGNYFKEGRMLTDKTRENALFLSICAQFNGKISTEIFDWFTWYSVIDSLEDKRLLPWALDFLKDDDNKNDALKFISIADLQIVDINTKTSSISLFDKSLKDNEKKFYEIYHDIQENSTTSHFQYDKDLNKIGNVDLRLLDESEGTKKFIALLYYLVYITTYEINLKLMVDELDARLHPLIVNLIVRLFNDNKKSNAQLIFTTHDTNLLDNRLFRRDQIWFTEKDKYGATDLFSLVEFKGEVRNDASFEKDYIVGRYGALPFIGDFSSLLE